MQKRIGFTLSVIAASLCGALASASALADDLFKIQTNVNGTQTSMSYQSVEAAIDALKGSNLSKINPAYTGIQPALINIDYRGTAVSATYNAGTALTINAPGIGLTKTFDGGTRDATQQQLKDYFKANGDNVLGKLSRDLAKSSAVDPIAGNPNSLMSQMVASDFSAGFMNTFATPSSGPAANLGTITPGYQQIKENGHTSSVSSLPLSWTVRSDTDPRSQFTVRVPLAESDTEGSKSYYAGVGVSVGVPMNDQWTLTPAFDYAVAGSRDLGSLAGLAAGSLTSSYALPFNGFDLSMGNMVGYYKAVRVKSGNYGYDPGIANTVLRNGFVLAQPTMIASRSVVMQYSIVDTQFFGTDLYTRHYDEFGVSAGTDGRTSDLSHGDLRAGVGVIFGSKARGFNVSLRARF